MRLCLCALPPARQARLEACSEPPLMVLPSNPAPPSTSLPRSEKGGGGAAGGHTPTCRLPSPASSTSRLSLSSLRKAAFAVGAPPVALRPSRSKEGASSTEESGTVAVSATVPSGCQCHCAALFPVQCRPGRCSTRELASCDGAAAEGTPASTASGRASRAPTAAARGRA